MRSPILLLVFNRPDTTRQVFATIRHARPPRLYIAADGPRPTREGEAQRCHEVREIVSKVDWPCEVFTLFRDNNLGCKLAVAGAISWFFEHEEEGIILEDDILAVPSFFRYCDELLAYYRDNPKVAMISGNNFVASYTTIADSYFFSKYCHIWGWATWRRAWQYYDVTMQEWPLLKNTSFIQQRSDHNWFFEKYWRSQFDLVFQNKIDTWDYQWSFTCWKENWWGILPKTNLTTNIGFDMNATHTKGEVPAYITKAGQQDLIFPLQHPHTLMRNVQADKLLDKIAFKLSLKSKLSQKYHNLLAKWRFN